MCDLICFVINLKLNSRKQLPGESYGFKYPLDSSQLGEGKLGDRAWFTKALQASGAIDKETSVSKVSAKQFLNNGLLSDIGHVSLQYDGGKGSEPTDLIVKCAPVEFETRITTDIFKLARTEFLLYKEASGQMSFSRIPKLYYGDINAKTGNYCLLLEKINADFYNILTNPSGDGKTLVRQPMDLNKARMCLHQLAKFHAMFPDKVIRKDSNLSFFPRVSEPTYKLFKVEATKHWKNGVASNRPNGIVHEGWTYKIPDSFRNVADDVLKNFTNVLTYSAEGNPECVGLTHGDPRIDNWFFYKNENGEDDCGILDFQLMTISSQPSDIAWLLQSSCDPKMLDEHEDMLIDEYLKAYEELRDGEKLDREMWMEEYALSYVGCIGKNIIGAGGIKAISEMVVQSMNFLLDGGFAGWNRRT